ncbi:MAG: CapA family protein [Evtepia sp.]|uniref:CapA family protein n=1 Tax=Evtepia sp. TaxID=2773933 RepID=UPI002A766C42|nr:CapA family protein [Evtepia sp.]MDY3014182.1 CapA family protein [Evtepia sp.]
MNKKLFLTALVLVLVCALLVFLGIKKEHPQAPSSQGQQTSSTQQTEKQEPITATLAVCGDIMSHLPQTNDAYDASSNTYSYLNCFQFVKPWIEQADFAVGNFETTLNGPPYSGYPQFCAPDALAHDIKAIGFDLVTTANNHSMDKGYDGLCRTLDVLDESGLQHVGTYRTQEEFNENNGVVVADVGGISVAFLGYSYGTNGIPIQSDRNFCLNRFNIDYDGACTTLDQEKLKKELSYAESLNTDLIAVMIHWGIEYQTTQNAYQDQVADFLIQNGADLILGSHSHVPQPMMTRTVTMDDGSTRSGFVCYSLGNFVSNQSPATVNVNYTDTTAVLNIELTKDPATNETTVSGTSYVPLLVLNRGAGVSDQYYIMDVHAGMAAYENGDTSLVTSAVYQKLQYALEGCHSILGESYDYTKTSGSSPENAAA